MIIGARDKIKMETVKDLKVIIYNPQDKNNQIVKNFLKLKNKIFFNYQDETFLEKIIFSLKEKGYKSKEVLILKKFPGRIYQKCPGSPKMICCNYRLLNTCFDCLYDCTYCFLNFYLNSFGIIQFINLDQISDEIKKNLDINHHFIYRLGTGEFTDSLMMDETTGLAKKFIKESLPFKNIMLEFKTKSKNISHLLNIKEKGNTVLAWSLNTTKAIKSYEKGTALLAQRLEAARQAGQAGFYLAFHFDPIIIYKNFMKEYLQIVDRLFQTINPDQVVWISLGGFRYAKDFKKIIRAKFPEEQLTTAEMFPGLDEKYRYFKKNRVEIYTNLKEKILSYTKKPFIYLCMESSEVWQAVFGVKYNSSEDLEKNFSIHLNQNFLHLDC